MYIFDALKDVYKTSQFTLTFALIAGALTAWFLHWQGIHSFSANAVNILLATAALYVGTFTAFLGVMYSLIVTPLSYSVSKKTYLKRLNGIKQAMDTVTVSIACAILSAPLGLLSNSSLNPAKCGLTFACHYIAALKMESLFTAFTIMMLTVVFALTITSLGHMYVLSSLAQKERREAIEAFFEGHSEFFEPIEKEKDKSVT